MKPKKQTTIITGSSKGLGSHIARSLAHDGFNIIINYYKNSESAKRLAKELSQFTSVKTLRCDVSKFTNVKTMVHNTLKEFGRIDIIINNAGIHKDDLILKMSQESWKNIIDTNLTGTFNSCKAVLPQMKKQQYGRIINIASVTAFNGISGAANYAASKAGVVALTMSLAKEVAKYNITVNAIAPGYFDIGMFNDFDKQTKNKILKNIPAKRLGQPAEISELIQILISSSYLTGQIFTLDGGYSC